MKRNWIMICLGSFMVLMCLAIFVTVSQQMLALLQSATWTSTTGTVLSSDVQTKTNKGNISYQLNLEYEYQANGMGYRGAPGTAERQTFPTRPEVDAALAMVPFSSPISVKFNPNNPSQSCSRCAFDASEVGVLVLVSVFVVLGVAIVVVGWQGRKRTA
jgi:hypothetical protein